jgi:pimeloyl-ACP methyl ester carboxylesterase
VLIDDVNGTRLNVIDEGEGHALLLLHGMGGSWREWKHQLDRLSDRYRCLVIEHRGHGRSERTTGRYSIDMFADDAAAVCRALDVTHAHVAGLAMGGMVGLGLALRHRWLVDSLVVANTAARLEPSFRQGLDAIARFVREQGFADTPVTGGTTAGVAWSPTTVRRRPEVIRDHRRDALSTDPDVYARAALAVAQFDVAERLADIRVPTLVLWGDHDVLVPRSYSEVLRDGIAEAEMMVVPDAGHLCTIEQPEVVARTMAAFFERYPCLPDRDTSEADGALDGTSTAPSTSAVSATSSATADTLTAAARR